MILQTAEELGLAAVLLSLASVLLGLDAGRGCLAAALFMCRPVLSAGTVFRAAAAPSRARSIVCTQQVRVPCHADRAASPGGGASAGVDPVTAPPHDPARKWPEPALARGRQVSSPYSFLPVHMGPGYQACACGAYGSLCCVRVVKRPTVCPLARMLY